MRTIIAMFLLCGLAAAQAPASAPVAGQTAVAGGLPALPAKAWLLMDFDSGEVLASANPDELVSEFRDFIERVTPSFSESRVR
jgi:D-alanyl-D-alanine carboxypeptidase